VPSLAGLSRYAASIVHRARFGAGGRLDEVPERPRAGRRSIARLQVLRAGERQAIMPAEDRIGHGIGHGIRDIERVTSAEPAERGLQTAGASPADRSRQIAASAVALARSATRSCNRAFFAP